MRRSPSDHDTTLCGAYGDVVEEHVEEIPGYIYVFAPLCWALLVAIGALVIAISAAELRQARRWFLASGVPIFLVPLTFGVTAKSATIGLVTATVSALFLGMIYYGTIRFLNERMRHAIKGWQVPATKIVGAGSLSAIAIFVIAAVLRVLVPVAHSQNDSPRTASPDAPNLMGDVNNNQGIITRGQTGGTNIINREPPRRPDGLYQGGQVVGMVSGIKPNADSSGVTLQNVRIASGAVDLTAPLELQNALIRCPALEAMYNPNAVVGFRSIMLAGPTQCKVLGPRPH